jgi:hypothetical protein
MGPTSQVLLQPLATGEGGKHVEAQAAACAQAAQVARVEAAASAQAAKAAPAPRPPKPLCAMAAVRPGCPGRTHGDGGKARRRLWCRRCRTVLASHWAATRARAAVQNA